MICKKTYILIFALVIMTIFTVPAAWSETYVFDPAHSSIGFAIRHLGVGITKGVFDDYKGAIEYDPADPENIKVNITIQAASINTRQEQRDEHLRNEDFFHVEKFPSITFTSIGVRRIGDKYWIAGDLTIKGKTQRVSIPTDIQGPVISPFGGKVIGLSALFEINRQDYGISWNKKLDQGGFVIDDIVQAEVFIEATLLDKSDSQ